MLSLPLDEHVKVDVFNLNDQRKCIMCNAALVTSGHATAQCGLPAALFGEGCTASGTHRLSHTLTNSPAVLCGSS